jgi:hypothetical protein
MYNKNSKDPKELLNKAVRVGGVIFSLVLGYLGALFSKQGFGELVPEFAWVGWVMAGLTIYLEVMFSRDMKHDPLLWWAGVGAYIWGMGTNIIGWASIFVVFQDPTAPLWRVIFSGGLVIVLSFAVEVLPERLILLGLFGDAWLGDALSSMKRGHRGYTDTGQRNKKVYRDELPVTRRPGTPRNKRKVTVPPVYPVQGRPVGDIARPVHVQDVQPPATVRAVQLWAQDVRVRTGKLPSVRKTGDHWGISKTKAAEYMKELR